MFKDQRVHILQKQNNHNQCISKLQRERRGGGSEAKKNWLKGLEPQFQRERERGGEASEAEKKNGKRGQSPSFIYLNLN